jgi:hypothetical protein
MLVPKVVLKSLDGLHVHHFFRDTMEDIRIPALQGNKQMLGLYAGCPLIVSHRSMKLVAELTQDVDPSNFGVSTLPASIPVLPPTFCAAQAMTYFSCF